MRNTSSADRRSSGANLNFIFAVIFLTGFSFSFSKLSYALNKGEFYNKEAQNIVNTADLVIKAEHSYLQNTGEFTGLLNLEGENPPYLSSMAVYSYNGNECAQKILMQSNVYICVNPQAAELNVFMPAYFASLNMVAQEISKGITGKTGQISNNDGLTDISFNLNNRPPSFDSNPDAMSPVSSITTSPNANGGTTYINIKNGNGNIIAQAIAIIANFFASALSLF